MRMRWWVCPAAVSAAFLPFTFWVGARFPAEFFLRPFSLSTEQGIGTWWSGTLLLIFALLSRSLAGVVRSHDPVAARGLYGLAVLGLVLFVDEMGSVHERVELFVPLPDEFALLPLALGGALLVGYSLALLVRRREATRGAHWLVVAAFGLFALVYLLERAEHEVAWEPGVARGLRLLFEEGLELAGMLLLIGAVVRVQSAAGVFEGGLRTLLPSQEGLLWLTRIAAVASLPVLAFRALFSAEQLRIPAQGDFGTMIPVALLGVAALLSVHRGILDQRNRAAWWTLAGVATLVSIDLQCHLVHYLWYERPALRWRSDLGLLWSTPLALLAALRIPPLRQRAALGGVALGYALVIFTAFTDAERLALVTPYPIAFALIYAIAGADGDETGQEAQAPTRAPARGGPAATRPSGPASH